MDHLRFRWFPLGPQHLLLFMFVLVSATYFDALDDSVLNKISWLGPAPDMGEMDSVERSLDSIVMSTARGEKYKCTLPKRQEVAGEDAGPYTGPSPIELLSPLFSQFVCTFKLETYWTYELCHGKYIRQYHEEREGKKVKLQEYFLGRWDKDDIEKLKRKIDDEFIALDKTQIPTKKIDGVNMPYLQVNMSDGTLCDLNGQVRNTRILYVCYSHGKHEIYSLEETSTCEYEIVVLSPQLCQHPNFKSKETGENVIGCHALDGAPKTPRALVELEAESFKIRHEHLLQNLESLLETKIKGDAKPIETFEIDPDFLKPPKPAVHDSSFLSGFLTGKHCLTGGSHWWKFEFCYGKHVLQYHEEPDSSSRTEIMLGKWNADKHKEYLDNNPAKKALTLTAKKNIVHYYTGGDKCDASGLPRTVEVKYKCVEHPSPSAIALYLLEPKTCEYTLGVESSLLCPFLRTSDDYGQFDISQLINSLSSSAPISSFSSSEKIKNSQTGKSKKYKSEDQMDIIMMDEDAPPQVA